MNEDGSRVRQEWKRRQGDQRGFDHKFDTSNNKGSLRCDERIPSLTQQCSANNGNRRLRPEIIIAR